MKQLELPIRSRSAVLILLALFGSNDVALAVNNVWQGPNLGDWRTDANWSVGAFPAACCDEVATINNNTTAIISPVPPLEPPLDANGLLLGQLATDTGGLRITNGGSLTTAAFLGGANGAMTIGQAGQGNLTILGGGSLMGPSLSLGRPGRQQHPARRHIRTHRHAFYHRCRDAQSHHADHRPVREF